MTRGPRLKLSPPIEKNRDTILNLWSETNLSANEIGEKVKCDGHEVSQLIQQARRIGDKRAKLRGKAHLSTAQRAHTAKMLELARRRQLFKNFPSTQAELREIVRKYDEEQRLKAELGPVKEPVDV